MTDTNSNKLSKSRLTAWIAAGAVLFSVTFYLTGFLFFISAISGPKQATQHSADGIVVLTGGSFRIADALDLLSQGKANRLLISGVYRKTSLRQLQDKYPGFDFYFDCCVDLGYTARNTAENAIETYIWARTHRMKSLIVVTSSYHMPRSMMELRYQLGMASTLIPFRVVGGTNPAHQWWQDWRTAKLLFSEYAKYCIAWIRISMEPKQ